MESDQTEAYILIALLFNGLLRQTSKFNLIHFFHFGLWDVQQVLVSFLHQVREIVVKINDLAYPPSWLGWGVTFPACWVIISLRFLATNQRMALPSLEGPLQIIWAMSDLVKTLLERVLDGIIDFLSWVQVRSLRRWTLSSWGTSIPLGFAIILRW